MDKAETKNKDKAAFACVDPEYLQEGLTKREYFASKAMQGYIVERHAQNDMDREKLAKWSVKMADELLKALENER